MSQREDRVPAWLEKVRPGSFPCPVCGADEWDQAPPVGLPTVHVDDDGNVTAARDDPMLILVPIACPTCGLTLFLDAQTAQVVRARP